LILALRSTDERESLLGRGQLAGRCEQAKSEGIGVGCAMNSGGQGSMQPPSAGFPSAPITT